MMTKKLNHKKEKIPRIVATENNINEVYELHEKGEAVTLVYGDKEITIRKG